MAKKNRGPRPPVVNVNTSTTVNAWDSTAFSKLLSEQAKANETAIKNLESAMQTAGANQQQLAEAIAQTTMMKDMKDILLAQLNDKRADQLKEKQLKFKEEEKRRIKESNDALKQNLELRREEAKAITNIAKSMNVFYSPLEKFRMSVDKMKTSLSEGGGIRGGLLKSLNIGGIFNKAIEREKFVRAQQAMGSEKSRAELKKDFAGAQAARKQIDKNEEKIKSFQKMTGLSESEMAKTKGGKELLEKRQAHAEEFAKYDERAKLVRRGEPTPTVSSTPVKPSMGGLSAEKLTSNTPTQKFVDKGQQEEADIENARLMGEQTVLLTKIEENTRGASPDQKAKPAEEGGGGGILGGIGAGLKALGSGIKSLGVGAGRGIQMFLRGLAMGLASLANPATLVGLGAATLAIMGIGKALQMAAPFMEAFAPVLIKVADVVQNVFVAAIEKLPEIIRAVGEVVMGIVTTISDAITGVIDAVTTSIERLAEVDGGNLLKVGAGLVAVAGGLIAFSAAQVGAGLSNIATGLLGAVSGQKTPIEQLKDLSQFGPNLEKAGVGVEKLGTGLKAFSSVDADKIKAIAALPTEKIAAMGAAMGNANTVYNRSGENAGAVGAGGGNSQTNVVNAPVNNVTKQTQIIRAPIRNRDSTVHEYMRTRYSTAANF